MRDEPLLSDRSDSGGKNFAYGPFRRFNHNVVVCWGLVLFSGCADSTWTGTALAAYLYKLMDNSNASAGYAEAAQGIASLLFALPVGWAADRGSKSRIIQTGGIIMVVAIIATSFVSALGFELAPLGYTRAYDHGG